MKPYFVIALVVLGVYVLWSEQEISRAGGVLAPEQPYQKELSGAASINMNGYRVNPLAAFILEPG